MKGRRPLSDEEFAKVLESFSGRYAARDRLLFILGCYTGFRITEILSLQVKDVYVVIKGKGQVCSHVAVSRKNTKGKVEGRTQVVNPKIKEAILQYIKARPYLAPDAPLFMAQGKNKAISRQQAAEILDKAFEAAELTGPLGTHTMRKTFAQNVYKKTGKCIIATSDALGHTGYRGIETTKAYLSFAKGDLDNVIANL